MLEKTKTIKGFAAFVKGNPEKGLCNRWSGGSQTGTNVQSITTDIDSITISDSAKQIEIFTIWFNNNHKNKVEFEIKEVERTYTTTLQIK